MITQKRRGLQCVSYVCRPFGLWSADFNLLGVLNLDLIQKGLSLNKFMLLHLVLEKKMFINLKQLPFFTDACLAGWSLHPIQVKLLKILFLLWLTCSCGLKFHLSVVQHDVVICRGYHCNKHQHPYNRPESKYYSSIIQEITTAVYRITFKLKYMSGMNKKRIMLVYVQLRLFQIKWKSNWRSLSHKRPSQPWIG